MAALHPECFGWAMVCAGRRRDAAEDLLQDVYARVLEGGMSFDGRSSLKTWLFGVIAQTARGRRRREQVRALLGLAHASRIDGPSAAPDPSEDALADDRRRRTLEALGTLPTRQQQVLTLVFYHDFSIEEAAAAMRVSIGSARTHYHRAKRRMAAALAGMDS